MKFGKVNLEKNTPDKFNSRFKSEVTVAGTGKNKTFGFNSKIDFQIEVEEIQSLIDEGVSRRAEEKADELLKLKPRDANLLAKIRLCRSKALELQARYRDALDGLKTYENVEVRFGLEPELDLEVQTQIAVLYNYLTDSPKSASLLKGILEAASEIEASNNIFGLIYLSLSRAYRSLGQTVISRGYAERALKFYREAGNWRGMVQCYIALSNLTVQEGKYEEFIEHSQQALNIIGERPENYWLGRIYSELAGAYYFLHRPHDGIACLEKSTRYFEQTEHIANTLAANNNLGAILIVIGEWERAEKILKKSLKIASEVKHSSTSMIYDSLGELYLLQERFDEAKEYLQTAVRISKEQNRKWYLVQALKNWGRFQIAINDFRAALEIVNEYLETARQVADEGAMRLAHLQLAEIHLNLENWSEFDAEIEKANLRDEDAESDLQVTAYSQLLLGRRNRFKGDLALAEFHFSRSLSLYEILNDFYYATVCRFELGKILSQTNPKRAVENLETAIKNFRKLQIQSLLEAAEAARAKISKIVAETVRRKPNLGLLTLRLTEAAAASREVLLREFLSVLRQESRAKKIIIVQKNADKKLQPFVFSGYTPAEAEEHIARFEQAKNNDRLSGFVESNNFSIFPLLETSNAPVFLLLHPRSDAKLADGTSIQPLIKLVELGLEVCSLREKSRTQKAEAETHSLHPDDLLPGLIHSSPGMTAVVEEIYKIRTSDITVLITGESGTGKEVVAGAIHTLSNRKDKIFIPFNCTAIPKELAEGHLFGYRKGAFTGAINDSQGVIRSADGGTLFLDEIGDLPLDLQPKLLRFLQEGEIQPLGEKKPIKVDVRVVAATNVSLEEKVAEGLFREDLYYRLNVIRLRVPPLRERRSEIPLLVNHYINHYSQKFGKKNVTVTPQTVDLLMVCDWEGNVRQLINEIQRLVVRAEDGETITPDRLSPELRKSSVPLSSETGANAFVADSLSNLLSINPENRKLDEIIEQIEIRLIIEALKHHEGNISRAAKELGISRRGLYNKLEQYQLYKASKPTFYF
ncbi:MAG: sigma 54-interacting transcriptional regulator [Acidobacteriota bacterium]|nr:sigma 54-interacting transcriptional regulator [Acidobacteriota bacterium]